MPSDPDLRDIVFRHDLFKKEMLVHQVVITQLHNFVEKKRGNYFWSFAKYILTLLLVVLLQGQQSSNKFTMKTFGPRQSNKSQVL